MFIVNYSSGTTSSVEFYKVFKTASDAQAFIDRVGERFMSLRTV